MAAPDWALLVWVLAAAYGGVMLLVLASSCLRRRHQVYSQPPQQALLVVEEGQPYYRTAKRGQSAIAMSGPGIDLTQIAREIKLGFVRKVYSILATQLFVTVGLVVGALYLAFECGSGGTPDAQRLTPFGTYAIGNSWLLLVTFVPLLFVLCMLQSVKNSYPANYLALALFTVFESISLALLCILVYAEGYGEQIVLAASICLGIFLVLTLFTMQSKVDWSFLGAGLSAGVFVLIFWSILSFWFAPAAAFGWHRALSLFASLLFCGFIVYDTHMIMTHFGVDDYIIAAIELYLDVVNLFQYLLLCLASGNNQ